MPRLRAAWQALFTQQQRFEIECRYQRKDGQTAWLLLRASAIYEKDGQLVADGITSDITEKKKLEHQFLRAQRMESIGTLAGGVAHDLNNILSPIMMSAPLLRMDELPADDFDRLVDTIETNAQRGSDIVRQLLAFGRGLEGERVVVQPRHIIKEMVKIARETFPKNLTVTADLPEQLWPIIGDPTHRHQVLLNLCINARDAMPGGGKLTIETANCTLDEAYTSGLADVAPGQYVMVAVSDTGTGMPPEVLARIFEPFYTTKAVNQGTGLGLSVVYGIVASHEGSIHVDSQPGKGSAFQVFLPLAETKAAATGPGRIDEFPGGTESVLIVEDETPLRLLLEATLRQKGYKAEGVADGLEAIGRLTAAGTQFDAVLLDQIGRAHV